jgi:hypothetical protein
MTQYQQPNLLLVYFICNLLFRDNEFITLLIKFQVKPPSYFNVMSQLRHAKENSSGPTQILTNSINVLCNSGVKTLFFQF